MHNPSPLALSKVILGSMGFSEPEHAKDAYVIHEAVERGMTSIDTAPLYGAGESERIVGAAIKDRRDRVQLLTKCGLRWDTDRGSVLFSVMVKGKPWTPRKDSHPQAILEEVDQCLSRLGTDHIDLMQVHHWDQSTPVAETMGALQRAQQAGKIRELGVSNFPLKQIEEANVALSGKLFSTQNLFNMLRPDQEAMARDYARRHGLAFLAYSPLGQGVLAGRHLQPNTAKDFRSAGAYYHPKNLERINEVINRVARPLAQKHNATLGQLSLAWSLAQPGVSAVIVGGRSREQILDSAGALELKIPQPELDQLGKAMRASGWDPNPQAGLQDKALDFARRGKRLMGRVVKKALQLE